MAVQVHTCSATRMYMKLIIGNGRHVRLWHLYIKGSGLYTMARIVQYVAMLLFLTLCSSPQIDCVANLNFLCYIGSTTGGVAPATDPVCIGKSMSERRRDLD